MQAKGDFRALQKVLYITLIIDNPKIEGLSYLKHVHVHRQLFSRVAVCVEYVV